MKEEIRSVEQLKKDIEQLKQENEQLKKTINRYGHALNACLSSIKAVAE